MIYQLLLFSRLRAEAKRYR